MREATLELISEGGGNLQPLDGIHPRAVDHFEAAADYAFDTFGGYHIDQSPDGVFSGRAADAKKVFPGGAQVLLISGEVPMYRDALVLDISQELDWPKSSPKNTAHREKANVDIIRPERSAFGLRRAEHDLIVGFRLATGARIVTRLLNEVVIDRSTNYSLNLKDFDTPEIDELKLDDPLVGKDEALYDELYLLIKDSEVQAVGIHNSRGVNPRLVSAHQQPLLAEIHLLLSHLLQASHSHIDTNGTSR